MPKLNNITFNLANAAIRKETLQGKNYTVAPVAMLTEGVHCGSGGPLMYKGEDCAKAVPAWNMKPIVVYHPEINGQGVSACDPDILERQQVGMVMNTRWDGKLRAEAWIDETLAATVDPRVIEALESNSQMEVSTGLFTDNADESGEYEGEAYGAVATNHQPDHLALLPDKIGACSIADGAGLLQLNEAATASGLDTTKLFARQMDTLRRMVGNAMSHSNIYSALSKALRERLGTDYSAWIEDVYDGFFVYDHENDKKLYKQGYSQGDAGVELVGEPEEVIRVTEYRNANGDFVGNEAPIQHNNKKELIMNKEALVNTLIANTENQWGEEDRETLTNMEEATLAKMVPADKADEPKATDEADKKDDVVDNAADTTKAAPTMEQYLADAPAEYRDVLRNGLDAHKASKAELIKTITANKRCKFSPEYLDTKGIQELQGLAALAQDVQEDTGAPAMFQGQAVAPTANASTEEPLLAPKMSFDA